MTNIREAYGNMADELLGTKCCASSVLNFSNLHSTQNCEKCAELEFQLQLVHDELRSVQLITQMINKEQVQKDPITMPTKHVEAKQTGNESWNMIYNKCTKRRSEGNMNVKDNQLQNNKEAILTANCFTPLITHSKMIINEDVMKPARKNITRATNSSRNQVVKNPELI